MKMKWMCVLALTASGLMAQDGPDGVDINSATALKRGLTEAHLEAMHHFEESPLFDARIKAALAR